ncbi:hypothetical protein C5167_003420 [Papaver somniferum]|uniref:Uncharacterized protein n=1 Tax=Papaver somniferum TaxID=3469 RepID=A0A4Y7L0Y6_PAPSO|nr:hypothetical protein C5167_003420 [Papaver somniferum]
MGALAVELAVEDRRALIGTPSTDGNPEDRLFDNGGWYRTTLTLALALARIEPGTVSYKKLAAAKLETQSWYSLCRPYICIYHGIINR